MASKPYYCDNHKVTLYNADCLDVLKELPSESIDLLCTDPPYGIGFMGKDWDKALPLVDVWRECFRVLKAGVFAFVMCIPRQDCLARMIVSLQDAGFNTNFTSIYWAYASGFPKAQNTGKAIDKRLGAEREVVGENPYNKIRGKSSDNHTIVAPQDKCELTIPASPQAKALDGSYGGFQPKPAVEVILVAMKPLSEKTYVDQALKNRKGITWLDDGRIPFEADDDKYKYKKCGGSSFGVGGGIDGTREYPAVSNPQGRFPANLLVNDDVLNDGRIQKSGTAIRHNKGCVGSQNIAFTRSRPDWKEDYGFGDTGSFSRYFDLDKWFSERIKRLPESVQKTFPFLIVPKASKSEKNRGLDYEPKPIKGRDEGQDVRNMPYKARSTPRINQHPTCKPLKLMCYLITLGSREGDIVLDPFLGSGTTALACQLLGRGCIGIEISEEYCEIARSRCNQQVLI